MIWILRKYWLKKEPRKNGGSSAKGLRLEKQLKRVKLLAAMNKCIFCSFSVSLINDFFLCQKLATDTKLTKIQGKTYLSTPLLPLTRENDELTRRVSKKVSSKTSFFWVNDNYTRVIQKNSNGIDSYGERTSLHKTTGKILKFESPYFWINDIHYSKQMFIFCYFWRFS